MIAFDRRSVPRRLAVALVMVVGASSAFGQNAPGPETFARPPKTPLEFWEAADYLVRSGQAPLAAPYLRAFLKANPDDAVYLTIRDRYGPGSVLNLDRDPATAPMAAPILQNMQAAIRRNATDPTRLARFVQMLTKGSAERDYAVDRLREAGSFAVPALVQALGDPSVTPESRAAIVTGMGRLDRSAVPGLIGVLGSPDLRLGADAAEALGRIGDVRAVPFLTYPAAWKEASGLRDSARKAIEALTGRPFEFQPQAAVRVLADQAWDYHRHKGAMAAEPTELWLWEGETPPTMRVVPKTAAESILGGRFAREALSLDPSDRSAQVALVSLALEKAAERDGVGVVAERDPSGAFAAAVAAGPEVLSSVLRAAMADGHGTLAAEACLALGKVADRDARGTPERFSPLVEALSDPDRRVQYAAASALVDMNPTRPFPGSSRVVPMLARFVTNRAIRALVIDGNAIRGNTTVQVLQQIGYDTTLAESGPEAFREAVSNADVELILLEPSQLQGAWTANDTMTNLRADARTAGIPIFLYGPLRSQDRIDGLLKRFPRVAFVVSPVEPNLSREQIGRGSRRWAPVRSRPRRGSGSPRARRRCWPRSPPGPTARSPARSRRSSRTSRRRSRPRRRPMRWPRWGTFRASTRNAAWPMSCSMLPVRRPSAWGRPGPWPGASRGSARC